MQSIAPAVPGTRERVAIQGEPGSFSHEAALALAPGARLVPCNLSGDVFRVLVEGEADLAVIPIENSLAGSVLEHYDLLLAQDVVIVQEYLLRVRHNLVASPGATLAGLSEVYSHPIALEQCRGFFRRHPHLKPTPFYDTAGSVKHVVAMSSPAGAGAGAGGGAGARPGAGAGAIASRQAAAQYGGVLLAEGIEDNPENYTRFLLIRSAARLRQHPAEKLAPPDGAYEGAADAGAAPNKVSLCFAVENRPGSLVEALQVFARLHTNLTRLESRPVPGSPWQYIFYADYQMEHTGKADAALAELVGHCSMVKELGRYVAAIKP